MKSLNKIIISVAGKCLSSHGLKYSMRLIFNVHIYFIHLTNALPYYFRLYSPSLGLILLFSIGRFKSQKKKNSIYYARFKSQKKSMYMAIKLQGGKKEKEQEI